MQSVAVHLVMRSPAPQEGPTRPDEDRVSNGIVLEIIVKKGSFYIAQYLVRWTAQSASHFLPSLTDRPVHSDTFLGFSGKHSSQAAITRQD